ncbi:Nlpc/p60 superfamily protein, partial [Monkeypox virus]
MDPVN